MSVSVDNYPSPYSTTAIPQAYVAVVNLSFQFLAQTALLTIAVYDSQAAVGANLPPLTTFGVAFGQNGFPTLTTLNTAAQALVTANPLLTPVQALQNAVSAALIANIPSLSTGTIVT